MLSIEDRFGLPLASHLWPITTGAEIHSVMSSCQSVNLRHLATCGKGIRRRLRNPFDRDRELKLDSEAALKRPPCEKCGRFPPEAVFIDPLRWVPRCVLKLGTYYWSAEYLSQVSSTDVQ